ncbi:MAG: PGPGW domain-containing protein [Sedimentisphaerales bacterium]|jgi:membrane protein implicated in regulation of membrane protease activity|nr:PGPGW domain-containing protein [Sedimentisphaerales bacterium]
MKRIIRTLLGIVLIALGLIAAITPLTPGSWLVPIGLEILGMRLVVQRRLLAMLPKGLVQRWAKARERKHKQLNDSDQ